MSNSNTKNESAAFFKHTKSVNKVVASIISSFLLLLAIGAWYGLERISYLTDRVDSLSDGLLALEAKSSSTTMELNATIARTSNDLSVALNQERQNVGNIASQLGTYQNQVGNITNTVSTLQKLSGIDKELLQKYSKVFFLNEHYAPAELVEIPGIFEYNESKHLKLETHVEPHLESMLNAALKDGITIYAFSAYRSFNEQSALKSQYSVTYGAGTANTFSADQGYSEHQLGTTLDLITTGLGGVLDDRFDKTKAYTWLVANAWKYGFTLSYPKDNTYYVYEPWHWRFAGVKLATDLHNSGKYFYDLDQRQIDAYLVSLFD